MTDEEYELVEEYLRKKYGNDYVDFIETEGQSYLDGLERGRKEVREHETTYVNRLHFVEKENEELKKNALVWHKVTCFDEPDEDGCITNDNPSDLGTQYLVKLKCGDFVVQELTESCNYGFILEDFAWEEVDAWAELPEV